MWKLKNAAALCVLFTFLISPYLFSIFYDTTNSLTSWIYYRKNAFLMVWSWAHYTAAAANAASFAAHVKMQQMQRTVNGRRMRMPHWHHKQCIADDLWYSSHGRGQKCRQCRVKGHRARERQRNNFLLTPDMGRTNEIKFICVPRN